jgi:P-type conjugative transfer protein TrbJ
MHSQKQHSLASILFFSLLACFGPSHAQVVYDPVNLVQNTITAKNSIQSLLNQVKQLEMQLQNLQKINETHYENTPAILERFASAAQQGKALSFGLDHLATEFQKRFPGYEVPSHYSEAYQEQSNTALDTLRGALASNQQQAEQLKNEQFLLTDLQHLSQTSQGNLQGLQTSHQIALQEINQLQKLRQLLLNQTTAQNVYSAYQLQQEQAQRAALDRWMKKCSQSVVKYEDTQGFDASNFPSFERN